MKSNPTPTSAFKINTCCLKVFVHNGIAWFRIFGYGLHFSDHTKYPPMFSERTGKTKTLLIKGIRIKYLVPRDRVNRSSKIIKIL